MSEAKRLLQALDFINDMAAMTTGSFRVRANDYLSVNGLKRLPIANSGETERKENHEELLRRLKKLSSVVTSEALVCPVGGNELTVSEAAESLRAAMEIIESVGTTGIYDKAPAAAAWLERYFPAYQ